MCLNSVWMREKWLKPSQTLISLIIIIVTVFTFMEKMITMLLINRMKLMLKYCNNLFKSVYNCVCLNCGLFFSVWQDWSA